MACGIVLPEMTGSPIAAAAIDVVKAAPLFWVAPPAAEPEAAS
jgi:hypothetical protein